MSLADRVKAWWAHDRLQRVDRFVPPEVVNGVFFTRSLGEDLSDAELRLYGVDGSRTTTSGRVAAFEFQTTRYVLIRRIQAWCSNAGAARADVGFELSTGPRTVVWAVGPGATQTAGVYGAIGAPPGTTMRDGLLTAPSDVAGENVNTPPGVLDLTVPFYLEPGQSLYVVQDRHVANTDTCFCSVFWREFAQ